LKTIYYYTAIVLQQLFLVNWQFRLLLSNYARIQQQIGYFWSIKIQDRQVIDFTTEKKVLE